MVRSNPWAFWLSLVITCGGGFPLPSCTHLQPILRTRRHIIMVLTLFSHVQCLLLIPYNSRLVQSSGVTVNESCLEAFQELKLRKKYKFIIFKLSDDNKEIVIEDAVEKSDYQTFIDTLQERPPRYAVYDFEYEKGEGERHKIVFYSWYVFHSISLLSSAVLLAGKAVKYGSGGRWWCIDPPVWCE